ncbi:hypothetical protein DCAR_0625026 [Daucus carota subsp. sativus]|uniref:Bromo domain-containing protein n=1 Tax=Daucus carota subsp. sativus TaxID=79200 RepID=A0AAF0XEH2_DAUCS|nr:PREDICTED: transcription factor GTE4 [Daucus carota subsp. sativus]WOH05607.1 hypothetical protein DCAR_0625026 [Daucus carota subsp. sativus]
MASMNGESEEPSKVYQRKSFKKNVSLQKESDELGGSDLMKRQKLCDDGGGKFGFFGEANRVTISLALKSKKEVRECRRKLQGELNLVRNWMSKIEGKESEGVDVGGLGPSEMKMEKKRVRPEVESRPLNQLSVSVVENSQGGIESLGKEKDEVDVDDSGVGGVKRKRVHPEVESRPLNQLSVSVVEYSEGGIENVGKEKRTLKANQFYRNSEFLLGKDKIPSVDKKSKVSGKKQGGGGKDNILSVAKKSEGSGKKQFGGDKNNIPSVTKMSKESGKKQGGGDEGSGLRDVKSRVLQTCKGLLQKLMNHKHGWVFNVPVDAEALGLHDYFDIIKTPMDLGTVKSRINNNFYQSPMEFMVDVRLTFQNAMTYNPKGQDVYVMAEQLLQLFEGKWAVIEANYERQLQLVVEREATLTTPTPTPTPKKADTPQQPPVETERSMEKSGSFTPSDLNTKLVNLGHRRRPAAPKKPKARDPNKREMTYEEKQELSSNLQSLPAEKLESVVDIIKKRNPSLCQHDDEIEVDIDGFDAETLWDLDRFFINYKKHLSKNKKNAELATKAKPAEGRSDHKKIPSPVVDLVEESAKETKKDKEANQTKSRSEASKSSGSGSNSSSTSTDSGSSHSSG